LIDVMEAPLSKCYTESSSAHMIQVM